MTHEQEEEDEWPCTVVTAALARVPNPIRMQADGSGRGGRGRRPPAATPPASSWAARAAPLTLVLDQWICPGKMLSPFLS